MKIKFLKLAIISALLSFFFLPNSYALISDAGNNSTYVSVEEDTTLSINLYGHFKNGSFSGFSTAVSNSEVVIDYTPGNYVKVQDHTSTTGHEVDVSFDDNTWYYGGSDDGKGNLTNYSTLTNPGEDSVLFLLRSSNSFLEWSANDTNICTANSSTMVIGDEAVISTDKEIASNTEACAGYSKYYITVNIVGPSNGFGAGFYTQTGTFTVTDGYN